MITKEIKKELKKKHLLPPYQEVADACGVTYRTVAGVMCGMSFNEKVLKYVSEYVIKKSAERHQDAKSLLNILNSAA